MGEHNMTRGTTPEHKFTLPFSVENLEFTVTYAQINPVTKSKLVMIRKTQDDCNILGNVIKVKLLQEDTLKFNDNYVVNIQIKVKKQDESVVASNIISTTVQKVLDEEVL
jgi:hypothetical protein